MDYARARLLTKQSGSQQSLITANRLYEALIASETDEIPLGQYLFSFGESQCIQGEYAKALEYGQKALTIRQNVYGEEHPELASSYYEIAFSLYALNEAEEAFETLKQSIERYCKFHFWEDAVEGLDKLAQWLEEQGKNSEAQEVRTETSRVRREQDLLALPEESDK